MPILGLGDLSSSVLGTRRPTHQERKAVSDFLKEARQSSKPSECILCGKQLGRPCKSHSLPQFVLKHIASSGHVFTANAALKWQILDDSKGIKDFETFLTICRDCDSKYFSEYENPDNWLNEPSGTMLSQIALKNFLHMRSKRLQEVALYDMLLQKVGFDFGRQFVSKIDQDDYERSIRMLRREARKPASSVYEVDYFAMLPYKVPLAFQDPIAMVSGFEGALINNIYNLDPSYQIQELHLSVFPLEKTSAVLCFTNRKHKRYRNFFREVRRLSLDEQLAVIQYLILVYAESPAFSDSIPESFFKDENVISAMAQESTMFGEGIPDLARDTKHAQNAYSCERAFSLPNLLTEAYAI